ncbi:MAG: hypothetical protein ABI779_25650 [Acidobacteriota bacterium]
MRNRLAIVTSALPLGCSAFTWTFQSGTVRFMEPSMPKNVLFAPNSSLLASMKRK